MSAPARTRRSFLGLGALSAGAALAACGPSAGGPASPGDTARGLGPAAQSNAPVLSGKLLYVADSDVWTWERGSARRLTQDRVSRQPVWSPDGKRIAHVKIDVSSSELWVMDADSANSRALTNNFSTTVNKNNWAFRPTWWPDGSRLLYLSEETTNDLMIWQIGVDGKNRRTFLAVPDFEGGLDMPAVSPDAKRLVAVSYRTTGARSQVSSYTLPSGPWRQLTEHPEGAYDPVWSPDGTRIAYTVRNKGRHDVWVMTADGSAAVPITDAGVCRAPCWSPDGQQLAYVSAEGGPMDVWVSSVPATLRAATPAASASGASRSATAVPTAVVATKPPPGQRVTRGLNVDAVSGLSWAK
jgi:TolB protein